MKIGQVNVLTLVRFTSVGAYLCDEEGNEVLFPNKYLTDDLEIDQKVEAFVYRDSEDRVVATSERPLIALGGFAYLYIKAVNFYGAFADWGLEKDLMIPFKEQNKKLEEGNSYLVSLQLDEETDRVFGSTKVNRYLQACTEDFSPTDPVDLLICDTTEMGTKVIVNNKYSGLIFKNDVVRKIRRGDKTTGFVSKVRPDGKLDIRLVQDGGVKILDSAERLLKILQRHKKLSIHDKSSPEEIREAVGMSKKTFKQAVGNLYKRRVITMNEDGIQFVESSEA